MEARHPAATFDFPHLSHLVTVFLLQHSLSSFESFQNIRTKATEGKLPEPNSQTFSEVPRLSPGAVQSGDCSGKAGLQASAAGRGGAGPGRGLGSSPRPTPHPAPPLNSDARGQGCERAALRRWSSNLLLSRLQRRVRAWSRGASERRRSRRERAPRREPSAFVRAEVGSPPALTLHTKTGSSGEALCPPGDCAAPALLRPRPQGPPGDQSYRASPLRSRRLSGAGGEEGVAASARKRSSGRWACGVRWSPHVVPGKGAGPGCAGTRRSDPGPEGSWGGGGRREGGNPDCRSGRLIVASSALKMKRPRLERGYAAHPGCATSGQIPSPRRSPHCPGRPDAGSGAQRSRSLGKQRRGRGGLPGWFKGDIGTVSSL